MLKTFSKLSLGIIFFTALNASASTPKIPFGIDCMIHDSQGKMLSDLGMVGTMMDGSYMSSANFEYQTLKIVADLNGPFSQAEITSPQIKFTVIDQSGNMLALLITSANPDTNIALFIPNEKIFLHCNKMEM